MILLRTHEAVDDEKSDRIESTAQLREGAEDARQYCWQSGKRYGIASDGDQLPEGLINQNVIKVKL